MTIRPGRLAVRISAGLGVLLALWTALLAGAVLALVWNFSGQVGEWNTQTGRSQIESVYVDIIKERADRLGQAFAKYAGYVELVVHQARHILAHQESYARENFYGREILEKLPNTLYSNAADARTQVDYCCRDTIPAQLRPSLDALSHLDTLLEEVVKSDKNILALLIEKEEPGVRHSGFVRYFPNTHFAPDLPDPRTYDLWGDAFIKSVLPENDPERRTVWTKVNKVNKDIAGAGLVVTVSAPMYIGEVFHGLSALDLSLDALVSDILGEQPAPGHPQLSHAPTSPKPFQFLLDQDGDVVALPSGRFQTLGLRPNEDQRLKPGELLLVNLADSTLPAVRDLGARMRNLVTGMARLRLQDGEWSVFHHPVSGIGWSLGQAVPEDAIMATAEQTSRSIRAEVSGASWKLIALAAMFVLGSLSGTLVFLSWQVLGPVRRTALAMRAAGGDLQDARVPIPSSCDEVAEIASSFNAMAESLRDKQAALAEAEARYRGIFANAVEGIFQTAPGGRLLSANPAMAAMLGYASPDDLMSRVTDVGRDLYTDQDDRQRFLDLLGQQGRVLDFEIRLRRKDGGEIWGALSARIVHDAEQEYLEGSLVDITDRKLAAEEVRLLTRELFTAREDERRRIHQRLHAQLARKIAALRQEGEELSALAPDKDLVRSRFASLSRQLGTCIEAVRNLACELRPPGMDDLGLAESLRHLCANVADQAGIEVNFHNAGVGLLPVSQFTRISLYRLVQESLANTVRHSGAGWAMVLMAVDGENLVLRVEDDGKGFELGQALTRAAAERQSGLAGMSRRTSVLGGRMDIVSAPQEGARITFTIPLGGNHG